MCRPMSFEICDQLYSILGSRSWDDMEFFRAGQIFLRKVRARISSLSLLYFWLHPKLQAFRHAKRGELVGGGTPLGDERVY